mmetsp:Transcript_35927/g.94188  ORF Transcript_35927/g.94188 Transcript_35927/m.94188 type:complete len:232 (-) Transcript_35927:4050-4745(-)
MESAHEVVRHCTTTGTANASLATSSVMVAAMDREQATAPAAVTPNRMAPASYRAVTITTACPLSRRTVLIPMTAVDLDPCRASFPNHRLRDSVSLAAISVMVVRAPGLVAASRVGPIWRGLKFGIPAPQTQLCSAAATAHRLVSFTVPKSLEVISSERACLAIQNALVVTVMGRHPAIALSVPTTFLLENVFPCAPSARTPRRESVSPAPRPARGVTAHGPQIVESVTLTW